jgi:NADH:ubiquinone oxidoreductase subunit E
MGDYTSQSDRQGIIFKAHTGIASNNHSRESMSIAEKNPQAVDNRRKQRRGKTKGRIVDINALLQVQSLLGNESRAKDLLIEHLHKIQDKYGHLSAPQLVALASEMKLAPAEVYEVASFYHHFDVVKENDKAPPALTVRVCESVSCEMAGSEALISALESSLGDGVRVQCVPCVGRCDMAPVAVVGQNTIDHAQGESVKAAVDAGDITQPMPHDDIDYAAYKADGGYQLYDKLLGGEISADEIIKV